MNTGSDLYLWAAPTNPLTVNASYSMYGNVENQNDNATFTGSNNLVYVDPLLDTAYNQTAASPGINKGICGIMSIGGYNRIAPYKDINGDSRPGYGQYLGCDIGADEYVFPWMLFNHLYK